MTFLSPCPWYSFASSPFVWHSKVSTKPLSRRWCCQAKIVPAPVYYGLGRHMNTISKHDLEMLCLWLWISVWNYYIGLGLAKLSIVPSNAYTCQVCRTKLTILTTGHPVYENLRPYQRLSDCIVHTVCDHRGLYDIQHVHLHLPLQSCLAVLDLGRARVLHQPPAAMARCTTQEIDSALFLTNPV